MADPLRLPLSVYQQQQFAEFRAAAKGITDSQNSALTTIIARDHDPRSFQGWSIELTETEIVCTPPPATPPAS